MKQRPSGFLSVENIDQEGEIFDYIRELHEYLWRYVKLHEPVASGKLSDYIDPVLIEQENKLIMSKIDEVIDSIVPNTSSELHLDEWTLENVRHCMIEYAKSMCDEQRKICLDNAQVSLNYDWITEKANPDVKRASIIDAPYPEELR